MASEVIFLTEDEVAARYRGAISRGTLRNWRCQAKGPPFLKVGRGVVYPLEALKAWEARNTTLVAGSDDASG